MDHQKRAGRLAALVFSLFFLPGSALAAIVIDSATVNPNPVAAGSTANITVDVTLSGDADADWESTNIALVKAGENPIELLCSDSPNFSNAGGAQQFTFNSVPIPNYIAGNWSVRVRAFDDDGECNDTSFDPGDAENAAAAVAEVTQPIAPPSVELDLILCLDGSTSLDLDEWEFQIAGTEAGLEAAMDPDHLDSTVRLTTIVFATGVNRAIGPTVIDSEGTLDAYRTAVSNLPRPTGSTNTAGCFSAALAVLCGSTTCPDDGIRRVIDISTDGNPTIENCPGPQSSTQCAILRRDEAESAGVDTLNVIGVGDIIGLDFMQDWAYPTPVQVFDTAENEFPQPGDRGFVVLVEEFADYGVAIAAKLIAEITGDFFVHKTYSDDNTTPVQVMLSCTGDTMIDSGNPATATPGGPAAVFNLSGFDPDNDTCTAEEVSGLPSEYTANESDCQTVPIAADGDCTIANNLSSATFIVTKDFIPDHNAQVSVSLSCSSGAPTNSPLMVSEGSPAQFTVEGFLPGATCTATETVPPGYTWDNPEDCQAVLLSSEGSSCNLRNIASDSDIDLVKTGSLNLGGDGTANPGDLITYILTVTNTGNTVLTSVSVSDPLIATITCPGGNPIASLEPGESVTCDGSYALTQLDVDNGFVENTASAEGECDAPGCPAGDDDTEIVPILQIGGLDIEKSAEPQTYSLVGQQITYTFEVTNTGNVTLANVAVSDPLITGAPNNGTIDCTPESNPIVDLAPGEVVSCTGIYTITQADIDAGFVSNSVSVIGECPAVIQGEPGGGQENCPPEDDDEETIGGLAVNLSKSVQSGPTLEDDGTYTVIYLITATNLGGGPGLYDVIDEFMPGSGITLNTATATYQAGTENDQSGTLGNFPTDDVIVTGEGLADGLTEFWVVDANFFVDPVMDPDPCDPGEPLPGSSFFNSVAGPDPDPGDDDTCAGLPPEEIDLSKTVVSLVEAGDGSFTVTYRITANNLGDGPGSYDLVDSFDPGTGINVVSAQLAAYVAGSENNQSGTLAGPLPYTFTSGETLVTGEDLAGQADESWTIVIQFDVDSSQVGGDYECAGPGTGTYNEVSGSETDPNPGNNSDCADPPVLRTTFRVTKDFDDDNPAGVTVLIDCNTGLPLQQQGVVHDPDAPVGPGDFTVIDFVVGDFEPGTMDCDIEEVIPAGYAPTYTAGATTGVADNLFGDDGGCHYELISGGQFSCHIFNELQPVDVVVEKIWIDESPEFQQSTVVDVTLECNAPIIGGFQCFGGEGNGNYCSQQFIDPTNPGEFEVLPHFGGTTCSATEEPISGVLTDESDCQEMIVFPGQGDSCVIVNTRLFAGIPTLSRNGLILLTLLMLGIGALAYRRFA